MEFLSGLLNGIWSHVIQFLLVLTVVVFIHELGHFLVARWNGVAIKAFSIGFGPEIFGFHDRHGTRWKFAWIPLGGYVKFIDDENVASAGQDRSTPAPPGAFQNKSVGQRAAIVAAGPIANFLLAIAIYAGLNMALGVRIMPAYVDAVVAGSPAEKAGFQKGDKIISADGQPIEKFEDLQMAVSLNAGRPMTFKVERGGETLSLAATPNVHEDDGPFGRTMRRGMIGIQRSMSPDQWVTLNVGPLEALQRGVGETYQIIKLTILGLREIFLGRQSADQLGGPIMMAEVTAKVAAMGFEPVLRLIALFSANIGFLNLLPIPVLDGGHLMFYAAEAVRRRPLSDRAQQIGFQFGLAIIATLMVFVFSNDLLSIWRRYIGVG